jgi:hypothetical protein
MGNGKTKLLGASLQTQIEQYRFENSDSVYYLKIEPLNRNFFKFFTTLAAISVADPDKFCPDPDPTFQIRIHIQIRTLAQINFVRTFPTRNFWHRSGLYTFFME